LNDAERKSVGNVSLWTKGQGVGLELHLHDLPPGEHAIHFHQNPGWVAPDFQSGRRAFQSRDGKKTGFDSPDGHHAGDLRNFTVSASGNANGIKMTSNDASLGEGSPSLFSNGGTAIVVHAQADDYQTDPSGNSGDRIACGGVRGEITGRIS